MQALVYTGPWEIEVQERPDPVPLPGQALLRILATGICGSDLHGFTGENGRRFPGQVMGHESVGEVIAVDETSQLSVGSLVTFNPVLGCRDCPACVAGDAQRCLTKRVLGVEPSLSGAMAQSMVVHEQNLISLPAGLHPDLGALVEPLAVGHHAVRRGTITPQDRVLVIGAGPIGQAVALAAGRAGANRIVVSEPNQQRRGLVDDLGFRTLDPTAEGFSDHVPALLDGPPDVVVDSVGTTPSMRDALSISTPLARIVLVGMESPRLDLNAYHISTDERTVLGSFCYSPAEFSDTAQWVANKGAALLPLIDHRVDLEGAPEAFRSLAQGTLQASKVLIYPHGQHPDTSPFDRLRERPASNQDPR